MKSHKLLLAVHFLCMGCFSFGQTGSSKPDNQATNQSESDTSYQNMTALPLNYRIAGTIKNVGDIKVYLTRWTELDLEVINTAEIIDGEFEMSGSIAAPERFSLMFGENDFEHFIPIFLGGDTVFISADYENLREAEISGAPLNEEVKKYMSNHFFNHKPELTKDAETGGVNLDAPDSNNGFISPQFISREKNSLFKYVEAHPASPVSPYLVFHSRAFFEFSYSELKAMNAYFDTSLNSSPDLIALRDKMSMLEKVAVNEKFTNISLPDTSGNLISISDYEGSCILLDFWASWCGPCIGEFPALKNTYQKYKDKGFTIIGISFDQDLDHWKNSILNEQLAWVHMSAPEAWASDVGKRYVIGGIPANVLIAPDGTIVGRNLQSLELNQKLSEIFGF